MRIGDTLVAREIYIYILSFLKDNYNFDVSAFKVVQKVNIEELASIKDPIIVSYITELLDEAIEKIGSCSLLFKVAKSILGSVNDLGLLGYIMRHSSNLNVALHHLRHYYPLLSPKIKPILCVEDGLIKLTLIAKRTLHLEKYRAEINFAVLLDILNQISEKPIVPVRAIFQHSKPLGYDRTYNDIFGEKIFFDSTENALYFDKSQLNMPTRYANPLFFSNFFQQKLMWF